MKPILLIDFGSTYTKVTAVDVESERLLGTGAAFTTIETDVGEGLQKAICQLEETTGRLEFVQRYACSSAAGGLRMIACGLVPELTAEAARLASLGAGAKVIKVYSFQLTEDDVDEIEQISPDILLLVGGTDGGNTECILHNAKMLSSLEQQFPIVVAGNRVAARACERLLEGHPVYLCENVMPKFEVLNITPAQKQIRDIFLDRIIQAKGLSKAQKLISGILMPTPAAVMKAMELLAQGVNEESGFGDLIAVDVGGATTDIYSIADGMPEHMNIVYKGLPEPYAKRTVEGDIGMRYSVLGILEAAGAKKLAELSGLSEERVIELCGMLAQHPDTLPGADREIAALDFALSSMAVDVAVERHAGTMEEAYTLMGLTYVQSGKDLSRIKKVILTGGSLINAQRPGEIAKRVLVDPARPLCLKPKEVQVWIDRSYILAAMGLLAGTYPETALKIMKKELQRDGDTE